MKRHLRNILLICYSVTAMAAFPKQGDFPSALQEKLFRYYARQVPAKAYLSFNQQQYIPGDTAFYKICLFHVLDLQPISGRQILTVQVLDAAANVVHDSKVLLTDGVGLNQIPIPNDLLPGLYAVAVFPPDIGAVDRAPLAQVELLVAGPWHLQPVRGDIALNFYPEGGHFINGITNKVVVSGPPSISGVIMSGTQQVATFVLDDLGTGFFFLVPLPGKSYFAQLPSGNLRVRLPDAESDGVGMLVTVPPGGGAIRVTIQIPDNSSLKSEKLFMVMTGHEKMYYSAALSFSDSQYQTFSMSQNLLNEGIARLTVFTEDRKLLSERLIYVAKPKRPTIGIKLSKESIHVRDTLSLEIFTGDDTGIPIASTFTISVTRDYDSLNDISSTQNLYRRARLSGEIRTPAEMRRIGAIAPDHSAAFTNYLIASVWNGFSWDDVWQEKPSVNPVQRYLHLQGTALRSGGQPLPDSTLITFFLEKSVMIYEVYPDPSGDFEFPLLMDFFGDEEIYYKAEVRTAPLRDVQVKLGAEGRPMSIPLPIRLQRTSVPNLFYEESLKRRTIEQSYAFHLGSRVLEKPRSLNALVEEEVFGPDMIVNLDDYLVFPTMTETIREIVPMLQHRRIRSRDVLGIYFDDRNRFAEEEPLLIIDGVISDNITYFLDLKPASVASIRIVNSFEKLRGFGAIGRNGIVLVETKIPENHLTVPRAENGLSARGLSIPSPSRWPLSPVRHPRIPDLRSNLYWNPDGETNGSGMAQFLVHASDVPGIFKVKVEGFTKEGQPFFAEESFGVFYQPD